MSQRPSPDNHFLTAPLGKVFAITAIPMAVVMTMNGLLGITDAAFLGHFVGADAITAVGISFPVLMLAIALSTLVSSGMSSMFARQLGRGARADAAATFASAHGLALVLGLVLALLFLLGGPAFARHMAGADPVVAGMVWQFLMISLAGSPVQFVLALHADAWRNEGRAGSMALLSLGVTALNILLNYVLIVLCGLGVAGSAGSTVLAQIIGLALLLEGRRRSPTLLPLSSLWQHGWFGNWRQFVALGAPVSLSFIGMAFTATCVLAVLSQQSEIQQGQAQLHTIAAYGVITRILGFAFLPMMALGLSMQSIAGNNVGAGLYHRARRVAAIAATTALVYGAVVELLLLRQSHAVASIFMTDMQVIAEVSRIVRPMMALYLLSGPVFMFGLYCQAIGQPARAGLLTLTKSFILLPGLIIALALLTAANSIWFAYPAAEAIVTAIAIWLLVKTYNRAARLGAVS
ncbi:MATE family efflux transporter [Agrobacterium sp. AGB01]|uniref:MATE family efflux transporter n=1 Tax=Agrobacterium sp. AGB01 TaxID=2769302 RepID=UPI00177AF4CE|nr:MATE family efflux transporter [Agrobacterium sp. AGB01]MBD9390332.1 MATE family efflux transporter [Agrobacterium sp. AGB01]